jgi:hypothetical protein
MIDDLAATGVTLPVPDLHIRRSSRLKTEIASLGRQVIGDNVLRRRYVGPNSSALSCRFLQVAQEI